MTLTTPRYLSIALMLISSTLLAEDTAKSIFNGKDLTGWKGNTELWKVEDGAITGTTTAEKPLKFNTFLIWEGKVADFELELDYKISGSRGNSGIQYRSKIIRAEDFVVGGYQADIDVTLTFAGINYEEKGRGKLTNGRGERVTIAKNGKRTTEKFADAKELGKKIKTGEWNHYKVTAKGNTLSHYINGVLMAEVIDDQEGKASSEGVLAFQIHQGPPMQVQFKNVMLTEH